MVAWNSVTRDHVSRAIGEYDRLGPEQFFSTWLRRFAISIDILIRRAQR
jgi:hypothetical protein